MLGVSMLRRMLIPSRGFFSCTLNVPVAMTDRGPKAKKTNVSLNEPSEIPDPVESQDLNQSQPVDQSVVPPSSSLY